jgi:hypothetical protein
MKPLYFLLLLLAVSCTVTKRVHQPGYSVQWNGKYAKSEQTEVASKEDEPAAIETNKVNETLRTDDIVPLENKKKANKSEVQIKTSQILDKISETVNSYIPSSNDETWENDTEYSEQDGVEENARLSRVQETSTPESFDSEASIDSKNNNEEFIVGRFANLSFIMGLISLVLVITGILLVLYYSTWAYLLLIPIFVFSLLALIFGSISRSRESRSKPNLRRRRVGIILGMMNLGAIAITAICFIVYFFYWISQFFIY